MKGGRDMKFRWISLIYGCAIALYTTIHFEADCIEAILIGISVGILSQLPK